MLEGTKCIMESNKQNCIKSNTQDERFGRLLVDMHTNSRPLKHTLDISQLQHITWLPEASGQESQRSTQGWGIRQP